MHMYKTWEHNINQYNLDVYIDENNMKKDKWWAIYQEPGEFAEETADLRKHITDAMDTDLTYMGVWDYNEDFVDWLGPHKDGTEMHSAAVFCVPRGELLVTLHDDETLEVIDEVVLSGNKMMALHHTKFTHDVKGIGYLVVFGLSKEFDADSYFMK